MRDIGRAARAARVVGLWLLAVVLLASVVGTAGCGGTPTTTTVIRTTTSTTRAVSESPALRQLVAEKETPLEVSQALATQKAMVILVYVRGGTDDELVKASLDTIAPRYTDVSFITYNFNEPQSMGDLTSQLGSHYPPFVAFVDTHGVVQYFTTGYADEAVFNQYVTNIRQL